MTPTSAFASPGTAISASTQEARDAARQKREADMKSAVTALESLKKSRTSIIEERKAAARQKIEQIKARIRMMRMSMPADPKAAAKMVAQLARELGAAVKAYASAGGAMSDIGGGASQGTGNTASATDATATDASGGETVASGAAATAETGEIPPSAETAGKGPEDARRDDPYRQALDRQQADTADQARKTSETQADKDLMAEVKKLVRELKSMLRQSAQTSSTPEKGPLSDQDAREAEKALASVEDAVADASAGLTGVGVSITV